MVLPFLALDLGGILFKPLWRQFGMSRASQLLGVDKAQFLESFNDYRQLFYTGKINEDSFWRSVLNKLKLNTELISDLKRVYRECVQPIPENLDRLSRLKIHFNLVSFNNSPREWMDYRVRQYGLTQYFSKFITSGYTGYTKPNPEAFNILIQLTGHTKIIYIDDNLRYVEATKVYPNIIGVSYERPKDLSVEFLRKF